MHTNSMRYHWQKRQKQYLHMEGIKRYRETEVNGQSEKASIKIQRKRIKISVVEKQFIKESTPHRMHVCVFLHIWAHKSHQFGRRVTFFFIYMCVSVCHRDVQLLHGFDIWLGARVKENKSNFQANDGFRLCKIHQECVFIASNKIMLLKDMALSSALNDVDLGKWMNKQLKVRERVREWEGLKVFVCDDMKIFEWKA